MLASGLLRKHFHVKCKRAGAVRSLWVNPWKEVCAEPAWPGAVASATGRDTTQGTVSGGRCGAIRGAAGLRQPRAWTSSWAGDIQVWGGPPEVKGQPAATGGAAARRQAFIHSRDPEWAVVWSGAGGVYQADPVSTQLASWSWGRDVISREVKLGGTGYTVHGEACTRESLLPQWEGAGPLCDGRDGPAFHG